MERKTRSVSEWVQKWWKQLRRVPWQYHWEQVNQITRMSLARWATQLNRSTPYASGGRDPQTSRRILTATLAMVLGILLLWQWQIGIALSVGSIIMLLIHSIQEPRGWKRWQQIRRLVQSSYAPLILAVGGGLLATLGTYTIVSIWAESTQPWLTTGAIVQGLATLAILSLLLWEWWQRQRERSVAQFDRYLSDVASPDAFKRLTGVRRLQTLIQQDQIQPDQTQLAIDYLRLALDQEAVPVVREAMLEALQGWGILRRLNLHPAPGSTPPEVEIHHSSSTE